MVGVIVLTCDWLQIVVPDTISARKRAKLTALGAALVTHGTDCEESEVAGPAAVKRALWRLKAGKGTKKRVSAWSNWTVCPCGAKRVRVCAHRPAADA